MQPPGPQLSVVHGLPSSQLTGVPRQPTPPSLNRPQRSAVVQVSPSLQPPSRETKTHCWFVWLHESTEHGLLSLQITPPVAVHCPITQRSPVLHALPSSQFVVSATFWNTQPTPASQESAVQGLLSSHESVLMGVHTPPTHRSPWVQAFESEQGTFERGTVVHPVEGLHESLVHALPSSHESALPWQLPPAHRSPCVQAFESVQGVPSAFTTTQPVIGLHESVVQGLPSLHTSAEPPPHPPSARQTSVTRHRLPELHELPVEGTFRQPEVALHESLVQGFPSLQLTIDPTQVPFWQASFTVHSEPSLHNVPFVTFEYEQPPSSVQAPT